MEAPRDKEGKIFEYLCDEHFRKFGKPANYEYNAKGFKEDDDFMVFELLCAKCEQDCNEAEKDADGFNFDAADAVQKATYHYTGTNK